MKKLPTRHQKLYKHWSVQLIIHTLSPGELKSHTINAHLYNPFQIYQALGVFFFNQASFTFDQVYKLILHYLAKHRPYNIYSIWPGSYGHFCSPNLSCKIMQKKKKRNMKKITPNISLKGLSLIAEDRKYTPLWGNLYFSVVYL